LQWLVRAIRIGGFREEFVQSWTSNHKQEQEGQKVDHGENYPARDVAKLLIIA